MIKSLSTKETGTEELEGLSSSAIVVAFNIYILSFFSGNTFSTSEIHRPLVIEFI
jgi:hypothetical protein